MRFPLPESHHRKMVCKRCHHVMDDQEPADPSGEFFHKPAFKDGSRNPCRNAGKAFRVSSEELEPFERKRVRRAARRSGGRVRS